MPTAIELQRQGRYEELWQMCCGYLSLDVHEFMEVQNSLLLEQLELLNSCPLGDKIMHGAKPRTVEEFRQFAPLTVYEDYCPEFIDNRNDILPVEPEFWVRTSGRTGDYECKWVPITSDYRKILSEILFGVGILASCHESGDSRQVPEKAKVLYSVAPRPYISGTFADALRIQSPITYMPKLDDAEKLNFQERIGVGFKQAMSQGLDFFFGISLVLVMVGDKLQQSSQKVDIRPFIWHPRALWRLARGVLRSRMAKRMMLPKDIWTVKGIIGSGVDSWVYKDKINEYWGRPPLDLYSCTEGGVIATQTWDYSGMTFVPNLNFLEFIPEEEHLKWQMDHSYKPKTILLDEVEAGQVYEIVLTNFHGGAMIRYRLGDMVRITSLRNDKLGIDIPQMAFERRADDLISFMVIKLTEKQIWQAIEKSGVPYVDWTAYKEPGESVLHLLIETKEDCQLTEGEILEKIQEEIVNSGRSSYDESGVPEDWRDELDFSVELTLLAHGSFTEYTALKQSEGADPAHLKPVHINPSDKELSILLADTEDIIVVSKDKAKKVTTTAGEEDEKIAV